MSEKHVGHRCRVTERDGSTRDGIIKSYIPLSPNYLDDEAKAVYRVRLDRDRDRLICYPADMVKLIDTTPPS